MFLIWWAHYFCRLKFIKRKSWLALLDNIRLETQAFLLFYHLLKTFGWKQCLQSTVFPVVVTSFPQTEELSLGLKACPEFPIVTELGGVVMAAAHFSGYMDLSQTWQNQLPMISRKKVYRAGVLSPQWSHFSSFYTFNYCCIHWQTVIHFLQVALNTINLDQLWATEVGFSQLIPLKSSHWEKEVFAAILKLYVHAAFLSACVREELLRCSAHTHPILLLLPTCFHARAGMFMPIRMFRHR